MNWISVTERLPEAGQEVLMWVAAEVRGESDDGREIGQDVSQVAMGNCMTGPCGPYLSCYVSPFADFEHITHWMPLPPPPGVAPSHPPLSQGFDGSAVRPGPNHSTIEIWYDTEEQARAAHKVIRDLIDASGVKEDQRG
jgi:hypothetical protein